MAIHFEKQGHTAIITIDRPERRNSLDLEHFGHLANAWIRYRDDDELWTAIVTGVDEIFCVGADLKSFVPMVTDQVEKLASGEAVLGGDDFPDNAPLIAVLRDFELYKPVIAAINGTCAAWPARRRASASRRPAADSSPAEAPPCTCLATSPIATPWRCFSPPTGSTPGRPTSSPC